MSDISENYINKNKEVFDKHFATTDVDYPNESVVRFLAKCRSFYPNGTMLDWGCAAGRHTMAGCHFGFQVIAVDYVERCVKITEKKVSERCKNYPGKVIDYIVNQDIDIEKIKDGSLDVLLMFGVVFLNTVENQKQMLKNAFRMLKNGGRVFVDFRSQRDSIYEQGQPYGQ